VRAGRSGLTSVSVTAVTALATKLDDGSTRERGRPGADETAALIVMTWAAARRRSALRSRIAKVSGIGSKRNSRRSRWCCTSEAEKPPTWARASKTVALPRSVIPLRR
jgi:hypothetical protein